MSSTETYEPLLRRLQSDSQISERSSPEIEEFLRLRGSTVTPRWWLRLAVWESKLLWTLSGASIVVSVLNYMLSFVTVMFTGHLGSLQLAGASIATVGIQGLAYGIMVRRHILVHMTQYDFIFLNRVKNRERRRIIFYIHLLTIL